jgi:hypothetical protein
MQVTHLLKEKERKSMTHRQINRQNKRQTNRQILHMSKTMEASTPRIPIPMRPRMIHAGNKFT